MTSTVSIKDQLRKLVELQNMDVEVYRLRRDLHDRPLEIEKFKGEFEAKKATLKELEDKLKGIQLKQKDSEGELKQKEEAISKADIQLLQLKTNKEYQAKLLEIENIKADKSLIEEKILMGFDDVEAARKSVDAERATVTQYEKEFLTRKKEVEDTMAVAQDQLKVKESQRSRITPDVRPDFLGRYDRILQNKDGLAIVPVNNQACGGCYMHLTEQFVHEIKMHDKLMMCDMCARILYLPDEL